jgi:cell wall-associated NlpC family hydrolase
MPPRRRSRRYCFAVALLIASGCGEGLVFAQGTREGGRPAQLESSALADTESLEPSRLALIEDALAVGRNHGWLRYQYGSSDPDHGGFDCSGAVYYLLKRAGLEPPRSSAEQYLWVRDSGGLTEVPAEVSSLENSIFEKLVPGDLLFWGGTYAATDGRQVDITHVQIYLGREKDGRHVMVGASDGRSYRGNRQDGYGVFDFALPKKESKGHFVGFGPPPGLSGSTR